MLANKLPRRYIHPMTAVVLFVLKKKQEEEPRAVAELDIAEKRRG